MIGFFGACLLGAWLLGHLLILGVITGRANTRAILLLMASFLTLVYLTKPYTYDLNKYSIYLSTGYISTKPWHTPDGNFQLDEKDVTGEPFAGAYELGFQWLAEISHRFLPGGALWPRVDADYGDLGQRGPPRSDAAIFAFGLIGFVLVCWGLKHGGRRNPDGSLLSAPDMLLVSILVLGSIFFLLGSQNTLRQFLAMSIVINGIVLAMSRRYFMAILVCGLSALFHKWAPFLGVLAIFIALSTNLEFSLARDKGVVSFRPGKFDLLIFSLGCMAMIMIKAIGVFGLFTADLPLIGELKHYLIDQDQYQSLERVSGLTKAALLVFLAIISEAVLGTTDDANFNKARSLRRKVLMFILPLAVFPEIFSRLLIVYWASELIFMVGALTASRVRTRLAGALVFCAYGAAPNAINVVIGSAWRFAL